MSAEDPTLHETAWQDYPRRLGSLDSTLLGCFPDFLIISPPRTGTTWLSKNLSCHPEIFIPEMKEVRYFCTYWRWLDINWYAGQFREAPAALKKGEASPSYSFLPTETIGALYHMRPNLRLIFLLRDPIERAWSQAKHDYRGRAIIFRASDSLFNKLPPQAFLGHFSHPLSQAYGDYLNCIKRWLLFFPKEQLYLGFYETIKHHPRKILDEIFEHVGVARQVDWTNFQVSEKINASRDEDLPPEFSEYLQALYGASVDKLASFLKEEFQLELPAEWKAAHNEAGSPSHPFWLAESYKGYKIGLYHGQFHAFSKESSPTDITLERRGDDPDSFKYLRRDSLYEIKDAIDQLDQYSPMGLLSEVTLQPYDRRRILDECAEKTITRYPLLVEEGYQGFNIVLYKYKFYALAQALGPFDLTQVAEQVLSESEAAGQVIIARSLEEVKSLVKSLMKRNTKRERALLLGNLPAKRIKALITKLSDYDILVLPLAGNGSAWLPDTGIRLDQLPATLARLRQQPFDLLMIPYNGRLYWQNQNLITLTAGLAPKTMILFADGRTRTYRGRDIHRLQYNAAYLNQLFKFVPPLSGQRLLDVGCSDGLVCDLMLSETPQSIAGIDVMATVGCNYPDPRISYARMDATDMQFSDQTFDLCYSIAVLEHVKDPLTLLREVKRVTRPGGYGYIQAGPLYFSPFGHHMFGHFDDYPWIHLRLSKAQIATYAREQNIAARIQQATNMTVETYLEGIFNPNHLNGRRLPDYHLDQFMADPEVEVLSFSKSYEGESLLTPEVRQELSAYPTEDLITHGFELVFRVK